MLLLYIVFGIFNFSFLLFFVEVFRLQRVQRGQVCQPVYVYTYVYMCEQMFARGSLTCPSLIAQ